MTDLEIWEAHLTKYKINYKILKGIDEFPNLKETHDKLYIYTDHGSGYRDFYNEIEFTLDGEYVDFAVLE